MPRNSPQAIRAYWWNNIASPMIPEDQRTYFWRMELKDRMDQVTTRTFKNQDKLGNTVEMRRINRFRKSVDLPALKRDRFARYGRGTAVFTMLFFGVVLVLMATCFCRGKSGLLYPGEDRPEDQHHHDERDVSVDGEYTMK